MTVLLKMYKNKELHTQEIINQVKTLEIIILRLCQIPILDSLILFSLNLIYDLETHKGLRIIRRSTLFNPEWYLLENPDVERNMFDPYWHYAKYGWKEGRNPGPDFSSKEYLSKYPDVRKAGVNPLVHYEMFGRDEGRSISDNTNKIEEKKTHKISTCTYNPSTLNPNRIEKIVFDISPQPEVSIIIPVHNKWQYTYTCLKSIYENTHDISFEIIIVDDYSTDMTKEILDKIEGIKVISNEKNIGFILSSNKGADCSQAPYILFLNNDTIVTEHWLSNLISTIRKNPQCRAVGCKLVYPEGILQEAGSILWNNGSASAYGRGDDPMKPEYSYVREVDFCSGACLLVRNDLFKGVHGFDTGYLPAYYEDADLCLKFSNLGYKIIYQPDTTVFHFEYTSSSKKQAIRQMEDNRSRFVKNWDNILQYKYTLLSDVNFFDTVLQARDVQEGKKILVLEDRIPALHQGSGYPRANKLLFMIRKLGYKVTFFPLSDTTPWQPYTLEFQQLGIEVFFGKNLNFARFAQQRKNFYDIIYISRPHNFEAYYSILKKYFPTARIVYDAEALFSTREILKEKIKGNDITDQQIKNLRDTEINLIKKADHIITVSENEKKLIFENSKHSKITVIGYPIEVQKNIGPFNHREDLLFVGSFLSPDGPNDDAIIYFVTDIWPKLLGKLSCKLFIVGINPPKRIQQFASPTVIVTGYAPDIQEYYNHCRIFIVPHRYAAGIPLKLLEAMSYGIPSVVSSLIASQLNLEDQKQALVAENTDTFVEKIVSLYQNAKIWENIQKNSLDYISQTCNPENLKKELQYVLEN